ncbi:hypothetical protein [Dactylosporangium sp. CA-139066]|uniref:hypothetical protein n=1 Tax=Dactylosporangium sp. CA-139066 TaxID=3239930 RepID=UPI003D8DF195
MDELWGRVRARIDDGDFDGLTDLLAAATPAGRAALLPALEAYEPPVETVPDGLEAMREYLAGDPQAARWEPGSGRERWHLTRVAQQRARQVNEGRRAARALAVAAGLPRAADVVRAANRRWPEPPLPLTAEAAGPLLRIRGAAWCATVGRNLARRARTAVAPWAFTEALLRAAGEGLPQEPAAVAQYVTMWRGNRLADVLADDPWFASALPYIFDDDRVGEAFGTGYAGRDWPLALIELTAGKRLPRETLIAGCLRRLRTGGRPGLLAPFLSLLGELAPAPAELAAHRGELLGLLAAPGSTVAGFARDGLVALDALEPLDAAETAELTRAMLTRPEKKLVRAHVAWLRRRPLDELFPDLAEALADGLQHPAPDLAELVLTLVEPRLDRLPAATRERLVAEVPGIEGPFGERLAELLGVDPAGPQPAALLVADPPAAMPAPLDLDDLVMEAAAWLRNAGEPDPVQHELVLDGLVRAARGDRDATARALATVQPQWPGLWSELLAAAAGRPVTDPRHLDSRSREPLSRFIDARCAELAERLAADPPGALLAFPATTAGHVDPERVLALLAAAERDGWAPGHRDLTQALLRLPREIGPAVRAGAERLASTAGRTFAEWVRREPCDPAVWIEEPTADSRGATERLACLELGADLPGDVAEPRTAHARIQYSWAAHDIALWPLVTPSHREIAAAHLTPHVAVRDRSNLGTAMLAGLAAADGPHGPAMALVLAYTLGNHRPDVRLAAADALLALAARPGFDGAATGAEIATLAGSGRLKLGRVVAPLTEAMRGGAHRAVAQVTAAALAPLLAGPRRPGLKDLIALDEAARRRQTSGADPRPTPPAPPTG